MTANKVIPDNLVIGRYCYYFYKIHLYKSSVRPITAGHLREL